MAKLVLVGMLLGGLSGQAFADLPSGGGDLGSKLAEIRSRAVRLNGEFPGFNLRVRENITTEDIADRTLQDLKDLDVVLHDDTVVPARTLINLACPRAYCFQD